MDPSTDPTPPTAPGNLRSTGKTSSSVSLAWDRSTDNVAVAAYDVYRGGTLVTSVGADTTAATVDGLSPATTCTFTVKARVTAGNPSAASTPVSVTTDDVAGAGKQLKVGYFVRWGVYGRQYFVKNLYTSGAAAKLAVVNYAFENLDSKNLTCQAGVTKGTSTDPEDPDQGTDAGEADAGYARPMSAAQPVDGVADDGWGKLRGNLHQLNKLKAKYPHLKVLASIGGWTYSKFFSDAAATPESRAKFGQVLHRRVDQGRPARLRRRRRPGHRGGHLRRHRPRLGVAGLGGPPWQPTTRRTRTTRPPCSPSSASSSTRSAASTSC